jgi:predicted small lipoprotein YifL
MMTIRKYVVAFLLLTMTACTSQQYYEGLKAGHRAGCLEYPESEYADCVDETETSFEEYKQQREQAIGNRPVD